MKLVGAFLVACLAAGVALSIFALIDGNVVHAAHPQRAALMTTVTAFIAAFLSVALASHVSNCCGGRVLDT